MFDSDLGMSVVQRSERRWKSADPDFRRWPDAIADRHSWLDVPLHPETFDDNMKQFIAEKPLRDDFVTLKATGTAQESMRINDHKGTRMILAGSGMCNGGRILHHLKPNLWKEETRVIIVGFQGRGSLGRRLVEGQAKVSRDGEKVVVRGQIHTLNGFNAMPGRRIC